MKIKIDVIFVTAGMAIGFIVIIMHLTDLWPCVLINKLYGLNHLGNFTKIQYLSSQEGQSQDQGQKEFKSFNNFIVDIYYFLTSLFLCK
jgi:hypothetical protein